MEFGATLTALPIRRKWPSRRTLLSDPFADDLIVVEGDSLVELLAATEAAIAARSPSSHVPQLRPMDFQPIDASKILRLNGLSLGLGPMRPESVVPLAQFSGCPPLIATVFVNNLGD